MHKPLFIVTQESFIQEEPIVDEQHHGVLAAINSLHYFLQQGQGLEVLMPTVKICMSYMLFHGQTEEAILRAANYPHMGAYIENYKQVTVDFKAVCKDAILNREPDLVLVFLRQWWQSHVELHEEIAPLITEINGQYCRLDEREKYTKKK
jgi:hemerythrin